MTIWILALLLLAALAGVGYNQGAIRVAVSLIGILVGAILAFPLGPVLKPVFMAVGIKNPILIWLIAPFVIFIVVQIIFKIIALAVHHKIYVYYKYKAGDLRLALWQRLNHRLGLCLGLVNGAVYLVLISTVIYVMSYWTTQMASSDADPRPVKLLNQAGKDLQTTGLAKAARAIDPMPETYYEAGDLVGTVYHNPLSHSRLSRYPGFLALAEKPEFQAIADDVSYIQMLQSQEPIAKVFADPKTKAIVNNPELLQEIWSVAKNDLKDLEMFLREGKSPKYDQEQILGRWEFDIGAAIAMLKRTNPKITSVQLQVMKKTLFPLLAKTVFIATPDQQAILKGTVHVKAGTNPPQLSEPETARGQWKSADGKYKLAFASKKTELDAAVEGGRLTISGEGGMPLVFSRED